MAKVTITFEDAETGVLIVSDPSLPKLRARAQPSSMTTMAEFYAAIAWNAIIEHASQSGGDINMGELH